MVGQADHGVAVELRPATQDDIPSLLSLIRAMAAFEKLAVSATEESLRSSLFGGEPAARVLLACAGGKAVGYATYCFTFSSMTGKRTMWLDDVFVVPEFRGKGLGRRVMANLARIAIEQQCGRFEWIVLDWNTRAIDFYQQLGARVLEDWRVCRLDEDQLSRVAGETPCSS